MRWETFREEGADGTMSWGLRCRQAIRMIKDPDYGDEYVLEHVFNICSILGVKIFVVRPMLDAFKEHRALVSHDLRLRLLRASPKRDLWRQPESEKAKMDLIGVELGTTVNTYLWYDLGSDPVVSVKAMDAIVAQVFTKETPPGFGDIELHQSHIIPGSVLLRLRGNLRVHPSLILDDRYLPLYQFGHGDDHDDPTKYIHFPEALAFA